MTPLVTRPMQLTLRPRLAYSVTRTWNQRELVRSIAACRLGIKYMKSIMIR